MSSASTSFLPPIFAQAEATKIRYVAGMISEGNSQAIIMPPDSLIETFVDLKGKRVAFGKRAGRCMVDLGRAGPE